MKVEFAPGIKSISGSTKPRMGKRLVFRHYKSDKPGHGHATIYHDDAFKRRTRITEREEAARRLFSQRASYVKQLIKRTPDLSRAQAWAMAKADIPAIGQPPESIFLHGAPLYKAMNDHIPLVQVDIPDRPEGRYPVCTRENAERYGLTISSIIP
ncbi:MAG: hypothetical protein IKG86_04845 [Paludibacteraceae bacterium]|nr:hypothetical protein [Paludibacteraceae bacterium]